MTTTRHLTGFVSVPTGEASLHLQEIWQPHNFAIGVHRCDRCLASHDQFVVQVNFVAVYNPHAFGSQNRRFHLQQIVVLGAFEEFTL